MVKGVVVVAGPSATSESLSLEAIVLSLLNHDVVDGKVSSDKNKKQQKHLR